MRYLQLQKVSINPYTKASKNECVIFEELENDLFKITKGATDCKRGRNKERDYKYPISEWDEQLAFYVEKGFTPIDDVKRGIKEIQQSGDYAPIPDKSFRQVLAEFIRLNNEFYEDNYSKNIKEISEDNIKIVQNTILELSNDIKTVSVSDFNDALMNTIWTFIPRRMNHLNRLIAHSKDDFENIIIREQDMLDRLVQELSSGQSADKRLDILAAHGIKERKVLPEEFEYIKNLVKSKDVSDNYYSNYELTNAWAVTNEACETAMNNYLKSEGFKLSDKEVDFDRDGITYLWHGTEKSNLWSIMKSGLYLNPALIKDGVRICGKAYGYGSYFAPYMYKSLAYMSSQFSYNRDLGGQTGYILLFKVATGNPWYIHRESGYAAHPNHWEDFHRDHPGKHCCWAENNASATNTNYRLRWDEVIVYQQCQSSLAYVVEIKQKNR